MQFDIKPNETIELGNIIWWAFIELYVLCVIVYVNECVYACVCVIVYVNECVYECVCVWLCM